MPLYNPYMDLDKLQFTEKEIRQKMQKSPSLRTVYSTAKNLEYMKNFEIGQVLVHRNHRTGDLYKNNADVPDKYIVVNKLGDLPICRKLMVNGKPGKGLYCPAVEAGTNGDRFEEDPDAIDAVILGYDYDPFEFPKMVGKARERASRHNRSITFEKFLEDNDVRRVEASAVIAFIEDLLLLNNARYDLWFMPDQDTKHECYIYGITDNKDRIRMVFNERGGKTYKKEIRLWELTSSYSTVYYISEPVTLKEELEKLR